MVREWDAQTASVRFFVMLCVFFEAMALFGMAMGWGAQVRNFLLVTGGLWPDLLRGATGIYPGQSIAMFATSALLQGAPLHLFMNMVVLLWLAPIITDRLSTRALWPIAGLSALGTGGLFVALSAGGTPAVGASGALFGLIGVVGSWAVLDRYHMRMPLRPVIENAVSFILVNLVLMVLSGGVVAWEAHLGGLIVGLVCGVASWRGPSTRRSRKST